MLLEIIEIEAPIITAWYVQNVVKNYLVSFQKTEKFLSVIKQWVTSQLPCSNLNIMGLPIFIELQSIFQVMVG